MLFDLVDPRRDMSPPLANPSQGGESINGGQHVEVVSLRLEDKQQHANLDSYITPPTIYHERLLDIESGDEVEQIMSHQGRPLRVRKRAAALKSL